MQESNDETHDGHSWRTNHHLVEGSANLALRRSDLENEGAPGPNWAIAKSLEAWEFFCVLLVPF